MAIDCANARRRTTSNSSEASAGGAPKRSVSWAIKPVSCSSLLSPPLTPALVSRGLRQCRSLPLLLSPVLTGQGDFVPHWWKNDSCCGYNVKSGSNQSASPSVLFSHSLSLPSSLRSLCTLCVHFLLILLQIQLKFACLVVCVYGKRAVTLVPSLHTIKSDNIYVQH